MKKEKLAKIFGYIGFLLIAIALLVPLHILPRGALLYTICPGYILVVAKTFLVPPKAKGNKQG